jgi:lysozyme
MRIGKKGIRLIKHFEGGGNYAYNDPVGICTVGVGHALVPHRRCTAADFQRYGSREHPKMTDEHVDDILRRDLKNFMDRVTQLVRASTKQHEFDAMVALAFNIGLGGFEKSSVRRLHNLRMGFLAGRAFLVWNKGTIDGRLQELPGLTRRRKAERYLYRNNALKFNF